jgi:lipid-binding SYLF domain-containing protein
MPRASGETAGGSITQKSSMKRNLTTTVGSIALAVGLALLQSGCATSGAGSSGGLSSSDRSALNSSATAALEALYTGSPAARELRSRAKAILVFPGVLKGGLMFGGQIGNGVLRQNGRPIGYYNLTAASYGFQAGIQSFSYALFLMNDSAMDYLKKSAGWEVGIGPSVVIVDEGMAKTMTSTTLRNDVYAFVFGQTGLMAGAGLQGSRITQVAP